jgi:copper chaperone CopZ
MPDDLCRPLAEDFLKSSWPCVKTIVEKLRDFKAEETKRKPVPLFRFKNGQKVKQSFEGNSFFLRGSVEYSNSQLTLEEIQGIIGARMLATCGNYFHNYGLREPDAADISEICETLKKLSEGPIISFLLNTDDIEPDRYSMNPLKESIVASGQSAFPAAYARTEKLRIDPQFVDKYEGNLICTSEVELITRQLENAKGSYVDFVDSVKYAQLEEISETFGIDLGLYTLRMPIATLQAETKDDLLHHIIRETHRDYESISQAYNCMRRSMTKRKTLLTVPHSKKGYGSKRAARGKLHFEGAKLKSVSVKYRTTRLYPNEIDPEDVSIAKCEDSFTVTDEKLADYSFSETPSSPQFFLYSLGSPENAVLWHGIGAFAAPKLLRSYVSVRDSCRRGQPIRNLHQKYGLWTEVPLQFNLVPDYMWVHPVHRNIDSSIGCVKKLGDLTRRGMKVEKLSVLE